MLRKCTNHFRNMNSEVKLMICVDQNGQAVEISVADQMWLDDAYFKEKQLRLGTDAPRAALAYRVSTKGQVDHDDIPMQKIDCRKFAQKQGWRVVKEVAEKGVSGSKVSASKRDAIQQLKKKPPMANLTFCWSICLTAWTNRKRNTLCAGMVRPAWHRNVEYPRRSAENRDTWR